MLDALFGQLPIQHSTSICLLEHDVMLWARSEFSYWLDEHFQNLLVQLVFCISEDPKISLKDYEFILWAWLTRIRFLTVANLRVQKWLHQFRDAKSSTIGFCSCILDQTHLLETLLKYISQYARDAVNLATQLLHVWFLEPIRLFTISRGHIEDQLQKVDSYLWILGIACLNELHKFPKHNMHLCRRIKQDVVEANVCELVTSVARWISSWLSWWRLSDELCMLEKLSKPWCKCTIMERIVNLTMRVSAINFHIHENKLLLYVTYIKHEMSKPFPFELAFSFLFDKVVNLCIFLLIGDVFIFFFFI